MKTIRYLGFLLLPLVTVLAISQERGMKVSQQEMQTEKRVALVIGNGAYKDSPLRNPVNDARAMASTLKSLGFKVLSGENLNQKEMKRIIRDFGQQIKSSGVGLFYYAGHGIQSNGRNYLIPIAAEINKEPDIELESVDAAYALAEMEGAQNRMNIVILDACRNNPFGRSYRSSSRGLAQMTAPTGTFIAYSTAPGSIAADGDGSNGLYTQELIRVMRSPGTKLEDVFKSVLSNVKQASGSKQVPWTSSSVEGDFYFNTSGAAIETKTTATRKPAEKQKVKEESKLSTDPWLKDLETKAKDRENAEAARNAEARKMKAAKDKKIKAMSDDFAKIMQIGEKLADYKDKADAWSRFLERYKADIPADSRDDDMRAIASRDRSAYLMKAIREDFAKAEEIETKPIDEKQKSDAWSSFLKRYKDDIPYETRDDELKEKAKKKEYDHLPIADHVSNSIGMDFVLIRHGTFEMGGDKFDQEKPKHSVTISRHFYIGRNAVTQGQWKAIMGYNPSYSEGDNGPVEEVSWYEVQLFIKKLNLVETTNKYRLPTEAEWEFAARGGNQSQGYPFGGSTSNSDETMRVSEWCQDWFGPYQESSSIDPVGPSLGKYRIVRGGNRTPTGRGQVNPADKGFELGFRLVQDVN